MKSEPGLSRKEADDLLAMMKDDEEMRGRLEKVLNSELAGSGRSGLRDVGRLRR